MLATNLVSVNAGGTAAGNGESGPGPILTSDDGRFVVFQSDASDLTATPDTNGVSDIFVRDLTTGVTTLVSVNAAGTAAGDGASSNFSITDDGLFVAFQSDAGDLVAGDSNGLTDVFVRDLTTGVTTLVSVSVFPSGSLSGNGSSFDPFISADGSVVAFNSHATDLTIVDDGNVATDVFARDLTADVTTMLSTSIGGTTSGAGASVLTSGTNERTGRHLSDDGQFIVFESLADDLVPGDSNLESDVFGFDLAGGTKTLVSVDVAGDSSGDGASFTPAISADGLFVAFASTATDLTPDADENVVSDVFVRDLSLATTSLASVSVSGGSGSAASRAPVLSADGQVVVFESLATDLTGLGDDNGSSDVFARDLGAGETTLVSVNADGTAAGDGRSQRDVEGSFDSFEYGISPDGRFVTFESDASDLVSGDANEGTDAFARDLLLGITTLLSLNAAGDNGANGFPGGAAVTDEGRSFFSDTATDLVSLPDANGGFDVFATSLTGRIQFSQPTFASPEAGANGAFAVITVTRTNGAVGRATVQFTTADGTATAGLDYTAVTQTVTFEEGEVVQSVTIPLLDDNLDEDDETVLLALSVPAGADLGSPSESVLVILDNDEALVSVSDAAVIEGDSGTTPAVFTVRLSNPGTVAYTFAYSTADGTATAGEDYLATSGLLTFAPGETEKTVSVSVLGDLKLEEDETFLLQVFAVEFSDSGPIIGPLLARGTGVILADDSLVVVNTNDEGRGSLRKAILVANANPGTNTITFDIPGPGVQTIRPRSELPAASEPVVIDGYSQPGSAPNTLAQGTNAALRVELDGRLLGADANGIVIAAGSSVVQGLSIYGFASSGVVLAGAGGSVVRGNFLGVDAGGNAVAGAGLDGVLIFDSSRNFVGGADPAERNLISGQDSVGIQILGHFPLVIDPGDDGQVGTSDDVISAADARDNFILNNLIGTDASGTRALGNVQGVFINNASGNIVANNVVSGNVSVGIQVFGPRASGNRILGNRIGTDVTGTRPLGNGTDGVFLNGVPDNVVSGNVISANASVGVQIFGPGASGNLVAANLIGTDVTGTQRLGNGRDGVFVNGAPGNSVGGAAPGLRNVISANGFSGVEIDGAGASGNLVAGNFIGTDASGTRPLGNLGYGVFLRNTTGNTIGVAAPNVIAFNGLGSVQAFVGPIPLLRGFGGNTVQGNVIVGSAGSVRRNRTPRHRLAARATASEALPAGPARAFHRRPAAQFAAGRS